MGTVDSLSRRSALAVREGPSPACSQGENRAATYGCAKTPSASARALPYVRLSGVLLVLVGVLSGCSSSTESRAVEWMGGWIDKPSRGDLGALLLVVAQINATILAIVIGLGIATAQLASRYNISHLHLRRRDKAFLLLYATVGVIVPLLLTFRPRPLEAVVMVGLSLCFLVAAPFVVSGAAASSLPAQQIELAARSAQPRSLRRRSHEQRLSRAQDTLVGIRAESPAGDVRDQCQGNLQGLLMTALQARNQASGGHLHDLDLRAAALVTSVLGGAPPEEVVQPAGSTRTRPPEIVERRGLQWAAGRNSLRAGIRFAASSSSVGPSSSSPRFRSNISNASAAPGVPAWTRSFS